MKSLKKLIILPLVLLLFSTGLANAQDVLKIAASTEGVDIALIINADTLATGEPAERIYELERDAFYFVTVPISKDGTMLHIRAEEGDGYPPIILPIQAEGGSFPNVIQHRGDVTLENLWFDTQRNDSRNAGRPISLTGDEARIIVTGCYFENARGSGLTALGNNQKWYVTDSVFGKMGQRSTPGGNGRPIDIRDARPVDTLMFQNNTIYMVMDRVVRTQGASIKHFEFDHNTVYLHEGEHGMLQLGTVTDKAIVTNNLFIDTQWKGAHPNIAEQTQIENESHYLITFDTLSTDLEVKISNNNAAWSQLIKDFWAANSSLTSKPPLMIPSLEQKMGTEAFNAAFIEEEYVEFENMPAIADMADYINSILLETRPDPFPRWQETDLIGAPDVDASYPTTSASYTAAEGGFPLGDLNWFPDKKAEWQEVTTSTEDRLILPSDFELRAAYPNPFNPSTQLAFSLNKASNVSLKVYSVVGQEVFSQNLGMKNAGNHNVTFNASTLPSGVYLVRMQAGQQIRSLTITLLK